MKLARRIAAAVLGLSIGVFSFASLPLTAGAQDGKETLQRGYRTGYSDGYMAGYKDSNENSPRDFKKQPEYSSADRAYSADYGSIEDYKDGYRQGFEAGYAGGFDKQPFNAEIPKDIARRNSPAPPVLEPAKEPSKAPTGTVQRSEDEIVIPKDTELILELEDNISTEANQVGDKFRAKVVSPIELTGMTIEGHVSKVRKPGRLRRKGELLLAFDRILVSDTRWSNVSVILTEVLPVRGDNVKKVDSEGTVQGRVADKNDLITVATSTGGGAIIGGAIGGPTGVAVGAGVGAVFGVGSVVVLRGRHVRLNRLQQLRLKTTYETRIR